MAEELKDQRVVTMMSPTELEAIDEWMFENRLRSRGEAIRRLCRIGALWDGVSDDLYAELDSTVSELKALQAEAISALGKPSDEAPPWVIKYVIASLRTSLATIEHVAKIADISRRAASPSDVMKLSGTFSEVHSASLIMEQEILQEAIDRLSDPQGTGEEP